MGLSGLDSVLPDAYAARSARYERSGAENSTALSSQGNQRIAQQNMALGKGSDFSVPRNLYDISKSDFSFSHQNELQKSSAQLEFLNVQKSYIEQILQAQKGPNGESIQQQISNLKQCLTDMRELSSSQGRDAVHNLHMMSKELAMAVNATARNYKELRNHVQKSLEDDLDTLNALLMQIFDFNQQVDLCEQEKKEVSKELIFKKDAVIQALGDLIYCRVFPRSGEAVSIQTKDGVELAADYVRPVLMHGPEDEMERAQLDYINAKQTDLGGRIGAMIKICDEVIEDAVGSLDEFAWILAKRYDMQNIGVFTDEGGDLPKSKAGFSERIAYQPLKEELAYHVYQKFSRFVFSNYAYHVACNKNIYSAVDVRSRQNANMTLWQWLGLSKNAQGQDPYFDITVGAKEAYRVTISAQDDEHSLLTKLAAVDGIFAKIDRNGFLSIAAYEEQEGTSKRLIYGTLELKEGEHYTQNAQLRGTVFGRKSLDNGLSLLQALFGHYEVDELSGKMRMQTLIQPVSYPADLRFAADQDPFEEGYVSTVHKHQDAILDEEKEQKIVHTLWQDCAQNSDNYTLPQVLEDFMGFENRLFGAHQMADNIAHLNAGFKGITI